MCRVHECGPSNGSLASTHRRRCDRFARDRSRETTTGPPRLDGVVRKRNATPRETDARDRVDMDVDADVEALVRELETRLGIVDARDGRIKARARERTA